MLVNRVIQSLQTQYPVIVSHKVQILTFDEASKMFDRICMNNSLHLKDGAVVHEKRMGTKDEAIQYILETPGGILTNDLGAEKVSLHILQRTSQVKRHAQATTLEN
jgi:hypothetical protein